MISCHGRCSGESSRRAHPEPAREARRGMEARHLVTELRAALEAHRPELLRHCYRMLGSFADAEDLVQEVLLNAWRARDSYAGTAPLSHWLMRIATNACLDELGRRRRRARSLPQLEAAPAEGTGPIEAS